MGTVTLCDEIKCGVTLRDVTARQRDERACVLCLGVCVVGVTEFGIFRLGGGICIGEEEN